MRRLRPGPVILCADDYGLSAGVSAGILELATAQKISALSAIVTLPRWEGDGPRLREVRNRISVGLHINLTLGAPLGPMPRLAPDGNLPSVASLIRRALLRDIDAGEIKDEVARQIDRFEAVTRFLPDHVDGHQHVHALPLVRRGVLDALQDRYARLRPLIRDPADQALSISGRGGEMAKAYSVAFLATGFGFAARRRGFFVNRGFSGFSAFDTTRSYDIEIAQAMRMTGSGHILMCHPGHPDAELARLDPVVERRGQEFEAILTNPELPHRILKPERLDGTAILDWSPLYPA